MPSVTRLLPGSKLASSPSAMAWGVSLLAHLCAGVACCFLAAASSPFAESTEEQASAEVPVTLAWVSEPEREALPQPEKLEQAAPEPVAPEAVEPIEPPEAPLPDPPQEAVAAPRPPKTSEAPPTWRVDTSPPRIASLAFAEAPEHTVSAPAKPSPPLAMPLARSVPPAVKPQEPACESGSATAATIAPVPSERNAPPAYPHSARRHGHEGLVVLRACVSPRGACVSVAIERSSGHTELDEAAAEAVRTWQFRPALLNGAPAEAEVEIPIRFKLTD